MRWRNRWKASFEWHNWFAWRPVTLDGTNIWLERLERRRVTRRGGHMIWTAWEYRTKDGTPATVSERSEWIHDRYNKAFERMAKE